MKRETDAAISTRASRQAIDRRVGLRLRAARLARGMSQQSLGEAVDISFQQLQKYERGQNRVSASVLYEFSRILGVPVGYFFEGMPPETLEPILCPAMPLSRAQIRLLQLYEGAPLRLRRLLLGLLRWAEEERG